MKPFIDDATQSELDINVSNSYIELELPQENTKVSLFVYLIPRSESSMFVVTCWDEVFDSIVEQFHDEDVIETAAETWPLFARMLGDGIRDKYREGALIRLEDPDDGDTKWYVGTVVGNLSLDDSDGIFTPRMQQGISLVINRSGELLQEMQERQPNWTTGLWKGIKKGMLASAALAVGAMLGIDPSDVLE